MTAVGWHPVIDGGHGPPLRLWLNDKNGIMRPEACGRRGNLLDCGPMPRSSKTVLLVANGDLRQSANQVCWPAQQAMEKKLAAAVAGFGHQLVRAHPYKPKVKNGFIASQKEGLAVFA